MRMTQKGLTPLCQFCAKVGMNYASCSPFRVPIARLAAGVITEHF